MLEGFGFFCVCYVRRLASQVLEAVFWVKISFEVKTKEELESFSSLGL
jgi:hypothetical protein